MTKKRSDDSLALVAASALPVLALRLGVTYVRMKGKRRRGVRTFRRALIAGGMTRAFADQLAEDYAALGRLRTYLGRNGASWIPIRRR